MDFFINLYHPIINIPSTIVEFISISGSITLLIRLLEWCPIHLQSDLFILIAGGVSLQQKDHSYQVNLALKAVPLQYQNFFTFSMYPELYSGENICFKTSYLA